MEGLIGCSLANFHLPAVPAVLRCACLLCREAEQQARAAHVYGRTRQRFHRALAAAEDLEGADSSVFAAVGRKGQQVAGAADGSGDGGNPFLRGGPPGGDGGASSALADEDEDGGSTDVFDPASWDTDTRKQWEAFVSNSKVRLAWTPLVGALLGMMAIGFAGVSSLPDLGISAPLNCLPLGTVSAAAQGLFSAGDSRAPTHPPCADSGLWRLLPPPRACACPQVSKGKLWDSSAVDEGLPQVWVDLNRE